MKKGLIIGLTILLTLAFGLMTVAVAGTINFGGDATAAIDISTANCASGSFNWWAEALDPNDYVGAHHNFSATGTFDVDATISGGPYGSLHTELKADSCSAATFSFYGWQDFDVTNGHFPSAPYMRVGELEAYVSGSTSAHMDVDFTGSMYIFKDHGPYTYPTNPNPQWMLKGEGSYDVWHFVGMINKNTHSYDASSFINLYGTGDGEFGFSNAWAFHTFNTGVIRYPASTMYAQASGSGNFYQDGLGSSYLDFNGTVLPGGGYLSTSGYFNDGFYMEPSVEAY